MSIAPLFPAQRLILETNSGGVDVSSAAAGYNYIGEGALAIVHIVIDDDPNANNVQLPSSGPNGEPLILSTVGSGGSSTFGPTQATIAWIASENTPPGTISITWTGNEMWAANSIIYPVGSFDSSKPIGAVSGYVGSSTATLTFTTPSWTANLGDESEGNSYPLVFFGARGPDGVEQTSIPEGWGNRVAPNKTNTATVVFVYRKTSVGVNETIPATTDYDIENGGEIHSAFGIIIRGPVEKPSGASFVPPSLIQHRPPGVKPVGPVKADPMNPLTHGMIRGLIFQERAGHTTTDLSPLGGSCRVDDSVNPWGNAIDLGTAGQAVYLSGHNNYLSIVNWGSIMFRCRATETPVSNATIFVGGSVYTDFCIYRGSSNTVLQVCAGGVETGETVTTDLWDGDWHDVAFHWEVDVDQRYLWIDGSFEVTSSSGTLGNVDLSPGCTLGEAGVDPSGMEFEYCYMWNRWIRKEFKEKIAADPYQMLIPANNF